MSRSFDSSTIAIIGLGYVGLPLAVAFGKHFKTIGFDINEHRIQQLESGNDITQEVSQEALNACPKLDFTCKPEDLKKATVFIVTVPTPVDTYKRPDLSPLIKASEMIGKLLKAGDIVIYESTVYPGATEEVCVPILEASSSLSFNQDFTVGYSPERINPGDHEHRLTNIQKVTSGSTAEAAAFVDQLYQSIIAAGTHSASSIRVAEAAKVIENTQRDLNIALVNELAILFNRLNIDTQEVLAAAATKWNFLPFKPGLVGGHCIGVDPYYLTHKAQELGYHPEVILAGRRINDGMGEYVASQVIKLMIQAKMPIVGAHILILGLSFKENCPDLRNTRVIDVIQALSNYDTHIDVHDPWVEPEAALAEYDISLSQQPNTKHYDAIILCVGHEQFLNMGASTLRAFGKDHHILYDVKSVLPKNSVDGRL